MVTPEGNKIQLDAQKLDKQELATLKIIESQFKKNQVTQDAEQRIGQMLEKERQDKIKMGKEFESQIDSFNQKEMIKSLHLKEKVRANEDYWRQQMKWNEARKLQTKLIDLQGGTQPHFLTKIFKFQEQLDIKKDSDIGDTLPLDQVDEARQQRSRMHAGNKDL